jgi:hypothetical protein
MGRKSLNLIRKSDLKIWRQSGRHVQNVTFWKRVCVANFSKKKSFLTQILTFLMRGGSDFVLFWPLGCKASSWISLLTIDRYFVLQQQLNWMRGGEGKKWGKKERKERFDSRCTLIVYWLEGEFRHQMVSPWPNFDYIFLPVSFFFRFDRKKMLDIWFFFKLGSLFSVYES